MSEMVEHTYNIGWATKLDGSPLSEATLCP